MFRLLCVLIGFNVTTAYAHEVADRKGISATGTCLKKVAQDRGAITFTATALASNASESSKAATQEHQKLRAAIASLKLENATFETANFQVSEEREYQNKKWISKGYRTRISLALETSDIARLGDAIAAAAKIGVKEIDQLNTFVSHEKMKAEYESCLETATQNARDKALKLAKGAGVKLGKVQAVMEGSQAGTTRTPMMKSMMMAPAAAAGYDGEAGPTIESKAEDLQVSATVMFGVD